MSINIDLVWNNLLRSLKNDLNESDINRYIAICELESRGNSLCLITPDEDAREWIEQNALELISSFTRKFVNVSYVFLETAERKERITLTAEEEQQTIYQEIVNPQRVIVLPDYFRYWLPVLGARFAWMYVAFRQLAYLATSGKRKGSHSITVTHKRIAKMCGVDRSTFWEWVNSPQTWQKLKGLVSPSSVSPPRYTVNLSLPLTPHHTSTLYASLLNFSSPDTTEDDLRLFCDLFSIANISDNAAFPAESPQTVQNIVQQTCGNMNPHLRQALAAMIQEKLMPQNNILIFSHFFFEKIMPLIGQSQAWLYVILKKHTDYTDNRTIQEITIQGGFSELAALLGFSRPMTIYEYFNDISPFTAYLSLVPNPVPNPASFSKWNLTTNKWNSARKLRILTSDLPLEVLTISQSDPQPFSPPETFGCINLADLTPEKYSKALQVIDGFLTILKSP